MTTLLNNENQINFIFRFLIQRLKFSSKHFESMCVKIVNKNILRIYEIHFLNLEIKNQFDIVRYFIEFFLKIDLSNDQFILIFFFTIVNSNMNYEIRKFKWRMKIEKFMFIVSKIFDSNFEMFVKKLMQNMTRTYCLYIRSVNIETINIENVHFDRQINVLFVVTAKTKKIKNNKNIMFHFYLKYKKFDSKNKTYELFKHTISNHVIDFVENKQSFYEFIYFLFENEFKILRNYIIKYLKNDFIRFSQSFVDVSILFVKKRDDIFRLCVNYRNLNNVIIKNRYSLFLIDENLNRLNRTKIYTQLNFIVAYNRMRIKFENEWKTIFRTRYNHFEYQILFFDLINVFASFQIYINKTLIERFDVNVIVYLDDILIYFENFAIHVENVKWILNRFQKHDFFINLNKCKWHIDKINFLNYIIFFKNITMQKNKIKNIRNWFMFRSINDIQQFVDLINFYKRFIRNFSRIAISFISMLKNFEKTYIKSKFRKRKRNRNSQRFAKIFIFEIVETFEILKICFI